MPGGVPIVGYFIEVSEGLGDENDVTEYRVAYDGRNYTAGYQVIPGMWKPEKMTLKRGITTNMGFWEWRDLVRWGKMSDVRSTVTIQMINRGYETTGRLQWVLESAWPSKISSPQLKSDSSDFGIEEVTIAYQKITKNII